MFPQTPHTVTESPSFAEYRCPYNTAKFNLNLVNSGKHVDMVNVHYYLPEVNFH